MTTHLPKSAIVDPGALEPLSAQQLRPLFRLITPRPLPQQHSDASNRTELQCASGIETVPFTNTVRIPDSQKSHGLARACRRLPNVQDAVRM